MQQAVVLAPFRGCCSSFGFSSAFLNSAAR
jgi:hypothetical protein